MAAKHGAAFQGKALLMIANLLVPVAILLFAVGFFPYKPFIPGLADYEELDFGPPPEAPFDKLVFMVVDALRRFVCLDRVSRKLLTTCSDFVFSEGSGFQYTQR